MSEDNTQVDAPTEEEPTAAEVLRDTVVQKLTAEVSKSNLTGPVVEGIKALLAVYQTTQQIVREEGWEKQRYIDVPKGIGGMIEPMAEANVVNEDGPVITSDGGPKPKKIKKNKNKEAK